MKMVHLISWREYQDILLKLKNGEQAQDLPVSEVNFWSTYSDWPPAVFRIRIHIFLGLPDPDPLVRGMDPDPDPIIKQK